jgi:hypothetical protein
MSDENNDKKQKVSLQEMIQSVSLLTMGAEQCIEAAKCFSVIIKSSYDALLAQGFSESQAIELIIGLGPGLAGMRH